MLNKITRFIDTLNTLIGKGLSVALPIMTLTTIAIILLAQVFDKGWVWMSEIVVYLHGMLFMLTISYTFLHDDHVRVDVIYTHLSPKKQAWINLLGTLFLLIPTCVVILVYSYPFVASSWAVQETSSEGDGLPILYLLKTCLLLMPSLLILQAISVAIKSWQTIIAGGAKNG